jgi:hypothetical protein
MTGLTQQVFGTTAQWAAASVPLLKGVFGIELTQAGKRRIKIGDGVSLWPQLPYAEEELVLWGGLASEVSRAQGAESTLQGNINAEQNRAQGAESTLQGNINTEKSRAQSAESILQGNINAEQNRAQDAELAISTELTQEAARAQRTEDALQEDINAEQDRSQAAEEALDEAKINKSVAGSSGKLLQTVTVKGTVTSTITLTQNQVGVESGAKSTSDLPLPVASEAQAGVMPKESFSQIEDNTQRIESLENKSVHYSVTLPSPTPSQAILQAAYEAASGTTGPAYDMTSLDDISYGKTYTWYEVQGQWVDRGSSTVAMATNISPGIVKGSATGSGKVFVENNSSMSVNGWDATQAAISGNTGNISALEQEKLDIQQKTADAGKAMIVGDDGKLIPWPYKKEYFLGKENAEVGGWFKICTVNLAESYRFTACIVRQTCGSTASSVIMIDIQQWEKEIPGRFILSALAIGANVSLELNKDRIAALVNPGGSNSYDIYVRTRQYENIYLTQGESYPASGWVSWVTSATFLTDAQFEALGTPEINKEIRKLTEAKIDKLDGAAPRASPAFTGTPTAPHAAGKNYSAQIATTKWVRDNLQPVGTFYVQYPKPGVYSNDYGTAFPPEQRPSALFGNDGGVWTIVWDADRIFFRTGGSSGTEADRVNGLQDDGMLRIQGTIPNIASAGGSDVCTDSLYTSGSVQASLSNGGSGWHLTVGIETIRQGAQYNAGEVRPKNRRGSLWQKTAL